ncbi:MAG: hypothetical protein AAF789_07895, partial [Bacteroidota bacterium]
DLKLIHEFNGGLKRPCELKGLYCNNLKWTRYKMHIGDKAKNSFSYGIHPTPDEVKRLAGVLKL